VERVASLFRVTDYDGYGSDVLQQHDQTCIQIDSSVRLQSTSGEWLLHNHKSDATFVVAALIRHRKADRILSLRMP